MATFLRLSEVKCAWVLYSPAVCGRAIPWQDPRRLPKELSCCSGSKVRWLKIIQYNVPKLDSESWILLQSSWMLFHVPNVPTVGQRSLINDITTGDDIIDLQDHLHDLRSWQTRLGGLESVRFDSPISWWLIYIPREQQEIDKYMRIFV